MGKSKYSWLILVFAAVFLALHVSGQEENRFHFDHLKSFEYREIGPAKQSGRIIGLAVPISEPYTF